MFEIKNKLRNLKNIFIIITLPLLNVGGDNKTQRMFYILLWPSANRDPFNVLEMGKDAFFNRQCPYQNCFLTNETEYFDNTTSFDVIVFNAQNIQGQPKSEVTLPNQRSSNQLYVFFSIEPAEVYPLSADFDGYFNLTWTYRFDSNATMTYLVVMGKEREETLGPKKDMHWKDIKKMKPISKQIKKKLKHKKTAAAWFVSNCKNPKNNRQQFADSLKVELANYGHRIDVYGECGSFECIKYMDDCGSVIQKDYYFYLAFENSFSQDYVSEKVLHGLQNYAIPVVYGGAIYERFMAPYMFLNARKYGTLKLAEKMHELMNNRSKYEEYFKWHAFYAYKSTAEMAYKDEMCDFCALINSVFDMKTSVVFKDISKWWNGSVEISKTSIYYADN